MKYPARIGCQDGVVNSRMTRRAPGFRKSFSRQESEAEKPQASGVT